MICMFSSGLLWDYTTVTYTPLVFPQRLEPVPSLSPFPINNEQHSQTGRAAAWPRGKPNTSLMSKCLRISNNTWHSLSSGLPAQLCRKLNTNCTQIWSGSFPAFPLQQQHFINCGQAQRFHFIGSRFSLYCSKEPGLKHPGNCNRGNFFRYALQPPY